MNTARLDRTRNLLEAFIDSGVFGLLEVHAAQRIASSCISEMSFFDVLSVASAVWATQQGHVCFDLDDTSVWDPVSPRQRPDIDAWSRALLSSPLVHVASSWSDDIDQTRPLVLRGRLIYLARQWLDEGIVADRLRRRRSLSNRTVDIDIVDTLFDPRDRGGRQHDAVRQSLATRTSIVTGGPGTGKTYTIARILVAAVRHGMRSIALAAPTAKAAVQMRNSLTQALSQDIPDLDDDQRRLLEQLQPSTIHRLLGSRPGSATRFRHGPGFPLPHDLVVVDEMSMVSLPLMARLIEAISDATTLVLVGDPGQLDSVENGSILRDLTDVETSGAMPITVLEASRRNTGTRSSEFASAVRDGDTEQAIALLEDANADGTLQWVDTSDPLQSIDSLSSVVNSWRELARRAAGGDIESAVAVLDEMRILCAHREGPYGVQEWNDALAHAIADSRDRWRPGDLVIKTHNDLGQGLSNGDTGVVVRIDGRLVFSFRHASEVVNVPVAVDEAVELAFATTVHKAQGSEFSTVAVVVPPAASPLNTRELLYTAMTRAKPRAIIIGTRDDIVHAVESRRRRSSGLSVRLAAP